MTYDVVNDDSTMNEKKKNKWKCKSVRRVLE